ncbi:pilus assembly protein Flp/PilA [Silvibacterium bohemicum]|uniref:Pilus assembly protein Flp/PilA n=1 Tax=Silvibacterium bohemicum TaxID=1577686 RepID=A0A841JUI3_9BACT|nr:Flp family type IVb pilin [Silvibacterium bohemicum]MBB6142641.1 pilus assembly protein Flp/PilA [Silvibacterium bohemicum]
MTNIAKLFHNLIADESGQDMIEYALVAALVGLAAVAALTALATAIKTLFGTITTALGAA